MAQLVDFVRLTNDERHIYTYTTTEIKALQASGWHIESVMCKVFDGPQPGTVQLYRLVGGDLDHLYTTNKIEMETARAGGYQLEDIPIYVYPSATAGLSPIYRVLFPGKEHFYTTSDAEAQAAASGDGRREGISFYAPASSLKWKHTFDEIRYDKVIGKTGKRKTINKNMSTNTSSSEIQAAVSVEGGSSASFSWSLNEQIHYEAGVDITVGAKASGGVGIPLVAEGQVEVSGSVTESIRWGVSVGSSQTWDETAHQNFSVSGSVDLKPGQSVELLLYANWMEDLRVPFHMDIRVECTDGDVALTGDQIVSLLKLLQPELVAKSILAHEAILSLNGVFTGSYGVESGLVASDVKDKKPLGLQNLSQTSQIK